MGEDERGKYIWRTVGGRKIKIYDGEDLVTAMKNSGKFSKYVTDRLKDDDNDNNSSAKRKELLLKYKKIKQNVEEKKKEQENRVKPVYEKLKTRHDRAIEELKSDKYGSGTYDVSTLKGISYNDGFQVTFSQIGDDYDNDTYYKLCKEFLNYSSDGKVCAGKFEGTPEISFNVKDRQKAIELAEKYNQISIWDWANADEIKTGGTGRRLKL